MIAPQLMSSAKGDWQTPEVVLDAVREFFGGAIGLDPCTAGDNPTRAVRFFALPQDGLAASWEGFGSIYCNPPYGRGIKPWVDACAQAGSHSEVIALLPARPDTVWFQPCFPPRSSAICFWKGRLTFKGAPDPAPFPSVIVYWSPRPALVKLFRGQFDCYGTVLS